jgi:O-antigen/teichoic acid export membrane protein
MGDLGISQIAVREMARRPEDRASIVGSLCVAQLTMGVVLGVVGVGVAWLLMSGTQPRIMSVFVMATMPVGAVGALTIAAQARLRPELVIAPVLVQNVIWLAVVLTLGAVHAGLALYGVGVLGAGLVQAAVTLALVGRVTDVTFAGSRRMLAELLRVAWPIGLAGIFVTAYYRIDGVLLFHYRGATAAAYYSAAYRVLDVLQILPMTVSGVLLPLLASAGREGGGEARVKRLFELAIGLLLAVAVPVAACGAILAPGIVDLIYGHHYHSSIYLLQVLLPAFIPICLGYVLTSQLILHGLLRPYIAITCVGAVINVVANAIAIPRYGAAAAAWATLGTELMVMTGIAAVVRRRLGLRLPGGRALRSLAATAVTAAAVWLVRSQPLALGIAVAAIVYPPCLLASRAVSIAELRALLTRQAAADA